MKLKFLIVTLILIMLGGGVLPLFAQEEFPDTGYFAVTNANLQVRAQPTANSPRLQTAPNGTTLPVYGRSADGGWLQVGFRGVVGWVSIYYVSFNFDVSALPVTDATDPSVDRVEERTSAPDGTLVQNGTLIVFRTAGSVNIRALPSEDAALLGQLPVNVRATVTLLDPTKSWGYINYNGIQGWVALYIVNVLGDIRTVTVAGEPGSGTPLPVPQSPTLSLEQRAAVQRLQDYLGLYLGDIALLLDILRSGAEGSFFTCGPQTAFLPPYRPARTDYQLVNDLAGITADLNHAFTLLNQARAGWLNACGREGTILANANWSSWLTKAEQGNTLLIAVQQELALLTAR